MQTKRLGLIIGIVLLLTLVNTGWLAYQYMDAQQTVVIDIVKVFNEFNLKKDLEKRVEHRLNEYTNGIDSLKGVYTALVNNHAEASALSGISTAIDTMQLRTQRAYEIGNKNINEQVWVRLNSLLTEYGDEHHYRLIIGANGMGTVLYNRKGLDKTEELIKFINSKYELGH